MSNLTDEQFEQRTCEQDYIREHTYGYIAYDGSALCADCLMLLDDEDEQARAEPIFEYGTICFACGKVC